MTGHFYDQLQTLEETSLSDEERISAAVRPLLFWYEKNARDLPWRNSPTPYRVWISEIMLQQTRVEAVKPYFARFMEALPKVKDLAEVDEERLMKLWEGLGYYSRARNLKKAALQIMEEYSGCLPASAEKLMKLPGIGSYTAGAIASIAFGIPAPAVDGNVLRVLSRLLASRQDIRKGTVKTWMERLLRGVIPARNPGDFNQALIEIGAIVCLPSGEPKCGECPLESLCLARRRGLLKEIPVRSPLKSRRREELTVFLIRRGDQVAIRRRPDQGLLASLYELPNVEGKISEDRVSQVLEVQNDEILHMEVLPEAKHIFSHVEWDMTGYLVRLSETKKEDEKAWKDWIFVEKDELKGRYPLPNAFQAYRKFIK